MTEPSGRTASMPVSWARVMPWAMTWIPPAFVATVPPIDAESRAARSTPYIQPAAAAWRWTSPRRAPAPAVSCPESASTGLMAARRRRETMTGGPSEPGSAAGTPPPTRPVLPPWGRIGTPAWAQALMTSATSLVEAGRTTARQGPVNLLDQSVTYGATSSGAVSTCSAPTISARRAITDCRSFVSFVASVTGVILAEGELALMDTRSVEDACE
jgi:hypothetical protein